MKNTLIILVLLFSSSVVADVGDTYFCETKIKAKLNIENIDNILDKDEYFHFYWKNGKVQLDEEFSGGDISAEIIWSDINSEFFYATHYYINDAGNKIPVFILIYRENILTIVMFRINHEHQIYSASCKKL